nr:MAG TPA: hypothetical protein [Caudoviricetes sp.]DAK67743.1 MAG TPA: hypothetical protein [Caudoviricetes sp.]
MLKPLYHELKTFLSPQKIPQRANAGAKIHPKMHKPTHI